MANILYPVILAGGRGTRFWPRSRKKMAKQALALDGDSTMIQQTVTRLLPLAARDRFWIITNHDMLPALREQLPQLDQRQLIPEPVARNTAPAIGLAAFILHRTHPEAVIGMFPSDHVIGDEEAFRAALRKGAEIAAAGENIVVMGIRPTRPETGYGYIEVTGAAQDGVASVRRFTEKPDLNRATHMVASGNYYWNSGMFLWSAFTLVNALREHLPKTAAVLEEIAAGFGTPDFDSTFARLYSQCENISIDYAVLEPRSAKGEGKSNLYCIPAEFGWNDLGSWAALYEHRAARQENGKNVTEGAGRFTLDAQGNYIYAPKKFVAVVGVNDLVVVETDDALLITTRERSQDVGKIVKHLEETKREKLL